MQTQLIAAVSLVDDISDCMYTLARKHPTSSAFTLALNRISSCTLNCRRLNCCVYRFKTPRRVDGNQTTKTLSTRGGFLAPVCICEMLRRLQGVRRGRGVYPQDRRLETSAVGGCGGVRWSSGRKRITKTSATYSTLQNARLMNVSLAEVLHALLGGAHMFPIRPGGRNLMGCRNSCGGSLGTEGRQRNDEGSRGISDTRWVTRA